MANDTAVTAPRTTLQFLGAAEAVTGSKYLVTCGARRLLVDDGMFQGPKALRERNWNPLPVDPAEITDVLVTHAHMDHVGMLPRLVAHGFRGPIFATEGTTRLAEIVLRDGAKLQEQEAKEANQGGWSKHSPALPLYTTEDVERTLPLFVPVPFDEDLDLDDGIVARFTRAGHILGSASITLWTPTSSAVFSGDLGRPEHAVLRSRGTPPGAPYVLIESTYGDRPHPEPANLPHEDFADIVRRTIGRGGSVLVPAFAVDRTEIILKAIAGMRREGRIPFTPVYVNSPMANLTLDVYRSMPDELRDDLRPDELVSFEGLHSIRTPDESMAITGGDHPPAIIIAASGMAAGGRVLHHLETMLPDARNSVVFTGYQAIGTRGRQLVEGATKLKMHGQYVPVRAEIFQDQEFSVHADGDDAIGWLRELDPAPSTVFCVHGEPESARALAQRIERELPGVDAIVPAQGEVVVLDGVHAEPRRAEAAPVGGIPVGREVRGAAGEPASVRASVAPPTASPAPAASSAPGSAPSRAYRLVSATTPEALSAAVTAAMGEGFEPFGAPSASTVGAETVFLQALLAR